MKIDIAELRAVKLKHVELPKRLEGDDHIIPCVKDVQIWINGDIQEICGKFLKLIGECMRDKRTSAAPFVNLIDPKMKTIANAVKYSLVSELAKRGFTKDMYTITSLGYTGDLCFTLKSEAIWSDDPINKEFLPKVTKPEVIPKRDSQYDLCEMNVYGC